MRLATAVTVQPDRRFAKGGSLLRWRCPILGERQPAEFRPATAADLPQISKLMCEAFQTSPNTPSLDPQFLHWKYFETGPEWLGTRSFVLETRVGVVAHGCIWPVRLVQDSGDYPAISLMDWVASKEWPGAGLAFVKQLASLAPILLGIAGSNKARQILPRMGYKHLADQLVYARVLRPWLQFRSRPGPKDLRAIARLFRNTAYSCAPMRPSGSWSAARVEFVDESVVDRAQEANQHIASWHSSALLSYMAKCPGTQACLYELRKASRPLGYFIMSQVQGQSRIGELRLDANDDADYESAVALAVRCAQADPNACEVIATANTPQIQEALTRNGFRLRQRRPIFVNDPQRLLPQEGLAWDLTLLDDDFVYLETPEYPFLT